MKLSIVTNLNDSGPGSFRQSIIDSNNSNSNVQFPSVLKSHESHINNLLTKYTVDEKDRSLIVFLIKGTIKLDSSLPNITSSVIILSIPEIFPVTIDCNFNEGLTFAKNSAFSIVIGITFKNSCSNGLNLHDDGNLIVLCTFTENNENGILITSKQNYIGLNPENLSVFTANTISYNKENGIKLYKSSDNTIIKNRILHNRKNGIYFEYSSNNTIGGTVYTNADGETNNPTGSENTTTPVFIIPPLGNQISNNHHNGVYLYKKSNINTFNGNFIGTSYDGNKAKGNGLNGVLIEKSHSNIFKGCDLNQDPFVYYNVVSGNKLNGFHIHDSNGTIIQGNFSGINSQNSTSVANSQNGLLVSGISKDTTVGGPIPLGNNFSGNNRNGIKISDQASKFISYNSFCGLAAFGGAVPNGKNGMHITSSGLQIQIRTNVLSGNLGNGIKLSKNANHINLDPNLCGTNSKGDSALPNKGSGLVISGRANNNFIGSQVSSVIPNSTFSGNLGNGITIKESAHDNVIYHCNIGLSTVGNAPIKNGKLAILLTDSCYQNVIVDSKIDGNVLLNECAKNNKLIANPIDVDSQIIDKSKKFNFIIHYNQKHL